MQFFILAEAGDFSYDGQMKISVILSLLLGSLAAAYDIIPAPVHVEKTTSTTQTLKILSDEKNEDLKEGEAYEIKITPEGVHLRWRDKTARHHALTSLQQLKEQLQREPEGIPTGRIYDFPQYEWRGFMLDVARHYMPVEDMKRLIDELARYKFNKFHIHLTDDNGWRFAVPKYPRMAEVASKRSETMGNGIPEGGYYTREELKDIVAYCAERGMEVIPEMDAPGHSQALAAAYPEFFCDADGTVVRPGEQGPAGRVFLTCPAKEELWKFYDAAVAELALIFPSDYLHVGGDEAPTTSWDACPDCAKHRKQRGQEHGAHQMRDFLADLAKVVARHGKKPLYWYELDEELYREGETVFAWYANRTEEAAAAAKKNKLQLIIGPSDYFYWDFPQIEGQRQYNWMPILTLERAYSFEPEKVGGKDVVRGVQCNIWTERVPNLEHVMYQSFPRAMATAELGWTPAARRNWKNFESRVNNSKAGYQQRTGYTLERTRDNQPYLNQVYKINP